MALANYTDLQASIASWHHRSVSEITDFITLAEKRINKLIDSRIGEVEATLTATVGSRYIALPSGYQANYGLWLTEYGNRIEMVYVSPEMLPVTDDSNSQPRYYTIDGANIAFEYKCSDTFSFVLRYKKGYSIATTSTNDMLTNHPSCYLYGAMREASVFSNDDANAQKYEALFQQAIDEALRDENKNRAMATLITDRSIVSTGKINILAGDM